MTDMAHPTPDPAGAASTFWTWLRAGELRLQRCAACHAYRHPPAPTCAACGSSRDEWTPSIGDGEIWSATTISPPVLPAFAARVPYNAVVVRLDEGVFIVSNLIGDLPGDVIGARVRVVVTRVHDGLSLPLFRVSA
jgi:uncharacterized OB-fold protein